MLMKMFDWMRKNTTQRSESTLQEYETTITEPTNHIEQSRRVIDSFDEDRETWIDTVKRWLSLGVALALPIVAVVAVSNEVGAYFSHGIGGEWASTMYALAWACEAGLAALTYSLAAGLQKKDKHGLTLLGTFGLWLLFNIGSGVAQWVIAVKVLNAVDPATYALILVRVLMVSGLDLASVLIFAMQKGKSLGKFLSSQQKKAEAIRAINESELAIERAQEEAGRRRREDEQYLEGKAARERVMLRIEEIQAQALINHAERALLSEPKVEKERGYY